MLRSRSLALIFAVATCLPMLASVVSAHKASVKTTTTLVFGYGFARGQLRSPTAACKSGREVSVFKPRDGSDLLMGTALTNARGEWAHFKNYPAGEYYAKVAARKLTPSGHRHTCKAYTSPLAAAPLRITAANAASHEWGDWYDTCALSSPLPDAVFMEGPGTPPLGGGSVQIDRTNNGWGWVHWNGLDGQPLTIFKRATYHTYVDAGGDPPTLLLNVDPDGATGDAPRDRLAFVSGSLVLDKWQRWTVKRSSSFKNIATAQTTTLSAYSTEHPAATFLGSTGINGGIQIALIPPCVTQAGSVDDVTIYHGDHVNRFDFEG